MVTDLKLKALIGVSGLAIIGFLSAAIGSADYRNTQDISCPHGPPVDPKAPVPTECQYLFFRLQAEQNGEFL